jgi:hypothetical protein
MLYLTIITTLIALIVAFVALQQFFLARERFKLDLFEKRLAIYKTVEKFLEDAFTYRTVSSERKQAFYNDTQMAGFLFEQDIVDFLKKLRDMGDELTVAHEKSRLEEPGSNERMALGKVRERVLTELFDIHRDLRETFSPYLKLSKWHWGFIWKFSN